jgi:hypothetical protein
MPKHTMVLTHTHTHTHTVHTHKVYMHNASRITFLRELFFFKKSSSNVKDKEKVQKINSSSLENNMLPGHLE